jgi:diacylglycerol kinase family enzyme
MKVIILLNQSSGSNATESVESRTQEIQSICSEIGIKAEVWNIKDKDIASEAQSALELNPDAIVAAGGDGTVSAVASVLVGKTIPLGVLPLGTLNHFAKDLCIPLDISEALYSIAQNNAQAVDVASVNGRYFVNNSSIGVYPWMVKQRDSVKFITPRLGKMLAMAMSFVSCLRRFPLSSLRIIFGEEELKVKTPLVFIGNNEYKLSWPEFGSRSAINTGKLCALAIKNPGRLGTLRVAWRLLRGKIHEEENFEKRCETEIKIESRRRKLHVALDGEVLSIHTPLCYTIHPLALRVIGSINAHENSIIKPQQGTP